jgi:ferrochelatase
MRLESVQAVTGGRLLNDPSVTRFDYLTLSVRKVERGALFLAKRAEEVPEAVRRGAYGILFEGPLKVSDPEIAWIEVPSLARALPKLLRLWLMEHPRTFHLVPTETLAYMALMGYDHTLLYLDGTFETMSENILQSRPDQKLFCADGLFLDRLGVEPVPLSIPEMPATILSHTLFETTAVVDGRYHERLPVPPCTFDAFVKAYATLRALGTNLSLSRLRAIPAFDPVFLDAAGRPAPFGTTERAVILSDRGTGCGCFAAFDRASWQRRRIFLPTHLKLECDIKTSIETYDSAEDLVRKVMRGAPRCGFDLVAGMRREAFEEALAAFGPAEAIPTTKGLF